MRRLACLVALLAVGAAAMLGGPARASATELRLGPGDRIGVSVMGLPSVGVEATIEPDGSVNLGWLGRVPAAGRSLGELTEALRPLAASKPLKAYSSDGEVRLIRVDRGDLSLEVVEWRPVVVWGDVTHPGALAFRPGLTARRAIAQAGGASGALLARIERTAPAQIVQWQDERDRAALEQAIAAVRLWRIEREIGDTPDAAPPGQEDVAVAPAVLEGLIAEQMRIIETNRQRDEAERAYLRDALAQTRERIAIMERQRETVFELLAADEQEEKRTADLLERGLIPATRLADIRRTTLLSATRLLDLEESLSNARLEVVRLERALEEFDENRLARLLREREAIHAEELAARLQLELMSGNLAGLPGADMAGRGLRVSVIRGSAPRGGAVEIGLDEALDPGDTLLVEMSAPEPSAPTAE